VKKNVGPPIYVTISMRLPLCLFQNERVSLSLELNHMIYLGSVELGMLIMCQRSSVTIVGMLYSIFIFSNIDEVAWL
jgi:hypothetical protein